MPRAKVEELALQPSIVLQAPEVERADGYRLLHGAVGLGLVPTVGKTALRGERGEIGERAVQVAFPDLELAETG